MAKDKPVLSNAVDFSNALSVVVQTQQALIKSGKSTHATNFFLSALEKNTVEEILKLASTYVSFENENNAESDFSHLGTYRQSIRIEYLEYNDDEDDEDDEDDDDDNDGDIFKS